MLVMISVTVMVIFLSVILSKYSSVTLFRNNFESEIIYNGINKIADVIAEINRRFSQDAFDMNNNSDRLVKLIKAIQAFSYSPIFGTGFDVPNDGPLSSLKIGYHNDWSYILVAGGLISISLLLTIVYKVWQVHPILTLLFIIPGMSHTLLFTMQIFCLYGIIWGIFNYSKKNQLRTTSTH